MATETANEISGRAPLSVRASHPILDALDETGEFTRAVGHTIRVLPGTLRSFSEVMRQTSILVRETTPLLFVMNAFLGISTMNFGYFFLRSIGASDYLGVITGYVGPRMAVPTMFGSVFAAKVCCGYCAEIASMRIQQEIDALESTGVDPWRYVVGTRLVAALIYAPIATFVCLIGETFGAWFGGVVILHGLTSNTFFTFQWSVQVPLDAFYAMIGVIGLTFITTLVACFIGMRASGGPAAVGKAVARSLMVNLVLAYVLEGVFGVLFYGTSLRLPIGG